MFEELLSFEVFQDRFSTEVECMDYLYQAKWPLGFVCPECGHSHAYVITTRNHPLYECSHCHHQTSLTVGTILEGTRTDLRKWFIAFYLISTPKSISALKLMDIIHVTYKTAWSMLHKIRHAISAEDASCPLSGSVFVNQNIHGRIRGIESLEKQETLYVGASLDQEDEPKYLKIKLFNDKMDPTLKFPIEKNRLIRRNFLREHVVPQPAYLDFYYKFRHHSVFKLFKEAKQWIYKTFNGLCHKLMQPYLDEVCYRINMKIKEESIFTNLVQLCMSTKKEPKGEVSDPGVPLLQWG
jgi:transposase-like protein